MRLDDAFGHAGGSRSKHQRDHVVRLTLILGCLARIAGQQIFPFFVGLLQFHTRQCHQQNILGHYRGDLVPVTGLTNEDDLGLGQLENIFRGGPRQGGKHTGGDIARGNDRQISHHPVCTIAGQHHHRFTLAKALFQHSGNGRYLLVGLAPGIVLRALFAQVSQPDFVGSLLRPEGNQIR